MQFVELDTWAYLMRPKEMTKHGRTSYRHFVRKYLKGDPEPEYQYNADVTPTIYMPRGAVCCTRVVLCLTCMPMTAPSLSGGSI
jgi:hypothetical protein